MIIQPLMFLLFAWCCFVGYSLASNGAHVGVVVIASVCAIVGLQLSYVVGCLLHVS